MDIFMSGVAFAVDEDDIKTELAKILHRAPFPHTPMLNFEVSFNKGRRRHGRGKTGFLTIPSERAGNFFLQTYGDTGVLIKGSRVLFSPSTQPLNKLRLAKVRFTPWKDPETARAEKEQRISDGKPFLLKSFTFGRFLPDGSFSSEFSAVGSAEIACDLERRQVRFMLEKDYDLATRKERLMLQIMDDMSLFVATVASYPLRIIDAIVDSSVSEEPTVFIRASAFPYFAVQEEYYDREWDELEKTDPQRAQGLIPDILMPPGCFSLACTFTNESEKDAFVYAARRRLNLRRVSPPNAIRVVENLSTKHAKGGPNLDYLKNLPFQVAFEVEKAITNWTLSPSEAWALSKLLDQLCNLYHDAAAPIFRQFVSLLEEERGTRKTKQPMTGRRRSARQTGAANMTLGARLTQAVNLHLEEQKRPRGRLGTRVRPSAAISYTYHLILTPTRRILEGPTTDQSNSVLRRFGHHECFLRVSFQDEDRSKLRHDLDTSISDLLDTRYRPVLVRGCKVAGRQYEMLGYSMSGLKVHSLWFVTPFFDEKGRKMDAMTIRESLGDFSRVLYQPARLGARWSQAFSATDPSIALKPEEIKEIKDIRSSRTQKIMTDGCSPISTELATAIWKANQRAKNRPARGQAPSAFQFRLGGAKGVVVQDPRLQGRVVFLRPSQIKFEAPNNRTFDIQSTSARPKAMYLNRPLIVLMEYLQSSQARILELQSRSIDEARSIRRSFSNAANVLRHHNLGTSFRLPSLFRNMTEILHVEMCDPAVKDNERVYNDLICNTLRCAETHMLRELKYRAHIAVPGSFTLLGVSDEWNCLAEGQIYATVFDEKRKIYQEITGTVAITRSPQIHPGDIQVVQAVRREQLRHLTNVVVFSCRGDQPLSSCLGGGDLDGDDFNLILDPDLIPRIKETPGEYVSLPIKKTENPCDIEDVVDFIFDYIEADLVGRIAISHLRFSDLADPRCDECLDLAEFAAQAVDFSKTGTPVRYQDLPKVKNRIKPDFLAREGADVNSNNWYPSNKLLGRLFRRVPMIEWMPVDWHGTRTPSGGDIIVSALGRVGLCGIGLSTAPPSAELEEEMEYLLDEYCRRLLTIATAHTISKNKDMHVSEPELVSGTIMANWSDNHRRREAVGAMNLQTHQLVRAVRAEMRASHGQEEQDDYTDDWDWDDEDEDDYRETRQIAEMFRRAWAGWCVAEKTLRDGPGSYGLQSFWLIALGRMLELIKAARSR